MSQEQIQLVLTALFVLLFFVTKSFTGRLIAGHAERYELSEARVTYTKNIFALLLLLVFITAIAAVWEVSVEGLSVYFASFFAVVGVAFFASWSILSNITASIILFFTFPFKIGNTVRIQDGDNSVEGEVKNISLFNLKIKTKEGNIVFYPNNLALQKPIFILENGNNGE